MIRGIYSAASAMDSAVQAHEAVAQNLAFANVPGYRQRGLVFSLPDQSKPAGPDNKAIASFVDFRPGPLQHTGAPLDLAIDGDAFFALQGPGGTVYTRNGAFHLNANGQIVSQAGYPLLGAGGPLTTTGDGAITVSSDGSVSVGKQQVGQIQLTRFGDVRRLEPAGPTLFRADAGAAPGPATASVVQGYRESSNVQPAEALVAMIAAARHHEAAQRALRAIADSIQLSTRPQAS